MMKPSRILLALAALMLTTMLPILSACSDKGKYVRGNDSIYYTYWTFSFGRQYRPLLEADAESFHSLNDWAGADKYHVFYKDELVPGADPATIKVVKFPLLQDKSDYYYETKAMHVYDMASFKILKWIEEDFYARDKRYAYYDTLRFEPDMATFKLKSSFTAVDKNHVYRFGEILPLADPKTYEENWKGWYSRDKSHIWCLGELLEDADYATFTVDGDHYAHDKYGKFEYAKRVTDDDHTETEDPAVVLPEEVPEEIP